MRSPERVACSGRSIWRALRFGLLLLLATSESAFAQSPQPVTSLDTTALGRGPYSRMHTKLEKTIFKVDVLTVDVLLGDGDASRIRRLIDGRRYSDELADSVVQVAIRLQDAFVGIEFLRDVSLEQFLDGVDDNLRRVRDAEIIAASDYEMISQGMPRWYDFLEERGILKGDRMLYRITGDTLTTQYLAVTGETLLNQRDVGPERRLAVLGGYFVRGSDFRKGLVKSLFEDSQ